MSLATSYIKARSVVRSVVLRVPWLDRRVGKLFVRIDVAIRRRGILDSLLSKGTITTQGFTILFNPDEPDEAAAIATNGTYEPETLAAIQELLRPGCTFVDLGAHIGVFSLFAAECVGKSGRVFAFEPTPATHELASRNIILNNFADRITIEALAIGGEVGEVEFILMPGVSQANSVAQPSDGGTRIRVRMTTLDDYFRRLSWPQVDVVKMDIEGQELAAMGGMRELVARNPRMALVFEYHRAQLRRVDTDPAELFEMLHQLGFKTFTALHRGKVPLSMPTDLGRLDDLAKRANPNILAEQS